MNFWRYIMKIINLLKENKKARIILAVVVGIIAIISIASAKSSGPDISKDLVKMYSNDAQMLIDGSYSGETYKNAKKNVECVFKGDSKKYNFYGIAVEISYKQYNAANDDWEDGSYNVFYYINQPKGEKTYEQISKDTYDKRSGDAYKAAIKSIKGMIQTYKNIDM